MLLRDTPVVVLDEPTSALDPATERALLGSLRAALEGKTLILITHRKSALALVDRTVELPRLADA